jgi:DUF1680 family protein
MLKYVSLIHKTFGRGEGQVRGYPGHPEIELALLRLYKATGYQDAYDLALFFLEERGNWTGQDGKHYYTWERERRGESSWQRPNCYQTRREVNYWYCQAHAPILEQTSVEGHAVRCMYLLTAVADLLCLDRDGSQKLANRDAWLVALNRLWDNMVDKKMYLTGGIGAVAQWEGFGIDYFLPQGTDEGGCYAETCASIGVVFLAERLLALDLDARYADIMELCMLNTVMTAMSMDGKSFTYVNQLASSEKDSNAREEWFECSCCPPNLTRLFGSLGGYLWHFGTAPGAAWINVHMYTEATLTFDVEGASVSLEQKSSWPWEDTISLKLTSPAAINVTVRLRIPGWSDGKFVLTPPSPSARVEKGYLILEPEYLAANPAFSLQVQGFEPRFLSLHPNTNQNTLTLARGPIVYCAEDFDNPWVQDYFRNVTLDANQSVTEEKRQLEGNGENYVALKTRAHLRPQTTWKAKAPGVDPGLRAHREDPGADEELVLLPYYLRANRGGQGHMRVGFWKA